MRSIVTKHLTLRRERQADKNTVTLNYKECTWPSFSLTQPKCFSQDLIQRESQLTWTLQSCLHIIHFATGPKPWGPHLCWFWYRDDERDSSGYGLQVPLSMGFSKHEYWSGFRHEYWSGFRHEYWSGLPCPPPPRYLPDPGIKPESHVSCIGSRVLAPPGKPLPDHRDACNRLGTNTYYFLFHSHHSFIAIVMN